MSLLKVIYVVEENILHSLWRCFRLIMYLPVCTIWVWVR